MRAHPTGSALASSSRPMHGSAFSRSAAAWVISAARSSGLTHGSRVLASRMTALAMTALGVAPGLLVALVCATRARAVVAAVTLAWLHCARACLVTTLVHVLLSYAGLRHVPLSFRWGRSSCNANAHPFPGHIGLSADSLRFGAAHDGSAALPARSGSPSK